MRNKQIKFVIDSRYFRGIYITSMSDGVHSDYSGKTLKELKDKENIPYLIAVSENDIDKKIRIYKKSLCNTFQEITEKNYYDSMGILPTIRLNEQSFFAGNPYYSNLHMFCFTIHNRYFKGLRPVNTPYEELKREMDEHYQHIMFKGKIIKEKVYSIADKGKREMFIVPYSFIHTDGKKRFICNMVAKRNDAEDIHKARKDMAKSLLSLRKHHFLYFSGYDKHDDMEKFLDEIERKEYTILAKNNLFQFPINRESVSFSGSIKETGESFFYRIYDRKLFLLLLHKLRSIKRETI